MRHRLLGIPVLVAAVLGLGSTDVRGQGLSDSMVPATPSINAPIPTGNPGRSSGIYTAAEFFFLSQTRTLGNQVIARRGVYDASGLISGGVGNFIGSGTPALSTGDVERSSYAPGYRVTIGWKTEDNISIYASFLQTVDTKYHAGAGIVPRGFRSGALLEDSFLTADVFNFPSDYSGPLNDTQFDTTILDANGNPLNGNTYGIWNAADNMTITYLQRFTTADFGARVPMFQTEYSRVYGVAGVRYAWFFERFKWRTVDRDFNGVALPGDVADYNNTLSQRMYGVFGGCGHEVYLGNAFAVSADVTGAAMLNLVKERVKYALGDAINPTSNKRSRETFMFVPNINADVNLWWYPLEGVQLRFGYNTMMFFNTRNMGRPVGFDFGNIDPNYGDQAFRLVHGFNIGLGLFF